MGVTDGRGKGEIVFPGLRVGGQAGREAGETLDAEAAAPDFGAELMNHLLG